MKGTVDRRGQQVKVPGLESAIWADMPRETCHFGRRLTGLGSTIWLKPPRRVTRFRRRAGSKKEMRRSWAVSSARASSSRRAGTVTMLIPSVAQDPILDG